MTTEEKPMQHRFKDVTGTDEYPRRYYGRCHCGFSSEPTTDKDAAWDAIAEHIFSTSEFQEQLARIYATKPVAAEPPAERRPTIRERLRRRAEDTVVPPTKDEAKANHPSRTGSPAASMARLPKVWVVGSHADCDWVIQGDDQVSPRHCALTRTPEGHYIVEDLDSYAGTWVIRQAPHGPARLRVTKPMTILPGDQIFVGKTQLGDPPNDPINSR